MRRSSAFGSATIAAWYGIYLLASSQPIRSSTSVEQALDQERPQQQRSTPSPASCG